MSTDLFEHYEHLRFTKIGIVYYKSAGGLSLAVSVTSAIKLAASIMMFAARTTQRNKEDRD